MKRKVPTRCLSSDGKVLQIIFPPERRKSSAPIVLKPRTLELCAIKMSDVHLIIGTKAMLEKLWNSYPHSLWYSLNVHIVSRVCGARAVEILQIGQTFVLYDYEKIHQLAPSIGQR